MQLIEEQSILSPFDYDDDLDAAFEIACGVLYDQNTIGEWLHAARKRVTKCKSEMRHLIGWMEQKPEQFVALAPQLSEMRRELLTAKQHLRDLARQFDALN